MWVIFVLEPAGLLGACKPGSQARMDSTTGGLAFSHFYGGPVKKTTLNVFYVLSAYYLLSNFLCQLLGKATSPRCSCHKLTKTTPLISQKYVQGCRKL